jgi:hypothetical protein
LDVNQDFYTQTLLLIKEGKNSMSVVKRKPIEKNKALICKALTDVTFRKQLATDPAKALGVKTLTPAKAKEITKVLATLKEIDAKINGLADELLCANGGPCGIA